MSSHCCCARNTRRAEGVQLAPAAQQCCQAPLPALRQQLRLQRRTPHHRPLRLPVPGLAQPASAGAQRCSQGLCCCCMHPGSCMRRVSSSHCIINALGEACGQQEGGGAEEEQIQQAVVCSVRGSSSSAGVSSPGSSSQGLPFNSTCAGSGAGGSSSATACSRGALRGK